MKTFSITDIGRHREMNQDYVFSSEKAIGGLPNLFLVADGMGGHNAGDFASRYTVDTMVSLIARLDLTEPHKIIEYAIKATNSSLLEKAEQNPEMKGMGTTLVALTILEDKILVANVGDSRLYIINSETHQITRDHSLVQEMVRMGEMDEMTAKVHPDKNIITRAIGADSEITVDFFEETIVPGDEILMCSDGLTNMIEDEDIRHIILSQRDIAEKAEKLVKTANENGGRDNITVIVIEPFSDEVKGC